MTLDGKLAPAALDILLQPVLNFERIYDRRSAGKLGPQHRVIRNAAGQVIGSIDESSKGFTTMMARNLAPTHCSIKLHVHDPQGQHVLTLHRPARGVQTHMRCLSPDGKLLGEARQNWHMWRSQYTLYRANARTAEDASDLTKFGVINSAWSSLAFEVRRETSLKEDSAADMDYNALPSVGCITKNHMVTASQMAAGTSDSRLEFAETDPQRANVLERCVMLAAAVAVDIDQFGMADRELERNGRARRRPINNSGMNFMNSMNPNNINTAMMTGQMGPMGPPS